ncbi:hypothetical protein LP419_28025 [Massilia sp. H-1]|nr:hypothetical protein LP419_28025 [Massilia sp. H-1]
MTKAKKSQVALPQVQTARRRDPPVGRAAQPGRAAHHHRPRKTQGRVSARADHAQLCRTGAHERGRPRQA